MTTDRRGRRRRHRRHKRSTKRTRALWTLARTARYLLDQLFAKLKTDQ